MGRNVDLPPQKRMVFQPPCAAGGELHFGHFERSPDGFIVVVSVDQIKLILARRIQTGGRIPIGASGVRWRSEGYRIDLPVISFTPQKVPFRVADAIQLYGLLICGTTVRDLRFRVACSYFGDAWFLSHFLIPSMYRWAAGRHPLRGEPPATGHSPGQARA